MHCRPGPPVHAQFKFDSEPQPRKAQARCPYTLNIKNVRKPTRATVSSTHTQERISIMVANRTLGMFNISSIHSGSTSRWRQHSYATDQEHMVLRETGTRTSGGQSSEPYQQGRLQASAAEAPLQRWTTGCRQEQQPSEQGRSSKSGRGKNVEINQNTTFLCTKRPRDCKTKRTCFTDTFA